MFGARPAIFPIARRQSCDRIRQTVARRNARSWDVSSSGRREKYDCPVWDGTSPGITDMIMNRWQKPAAVGQQTPALTGPGTPNRGDRSRSSVSASGGAPRKTWPDERIGRTPHSGYGGHLRPPLLGKADLIQSTDTPPRDPRWRRHGQRTPPMVDGPQLPAEYYDHEMAEGGAQTSAGA